MGGTASLEPFCARSCATRGVRASRPFSNRYSIRASLACAWHSFSVGKALIIVHCEKGAVRSVTFVVPSGGTGTIKGWFGGSSRY